MRVTASILVGLPLVLAQTFTPSPGNFPAKGDGDYAGGIFCIPLSELGKYANTGQPGGSEAPKGNGQTTSGSGPYPAQMTTDSSLPNHTIFAPKTAPNASLGFIAWGNGACVTNPTSYRNLLTEIASYGYVVAADGTSAGSTGTNTQTKVQDMRDSVDWAAKGGASKYGKVDTNFIVTAGHSCGGLEAMSTAYHDDRIKRIILFNIAIFQDDRRYLLSQIKVPVAWFVGGPSDMGYPTSAKDYAQFPSGLPAVRASLDTGHGGTFAATNGGKQGKAAVAYLEWQFRNDTKAKAVITDPTSANSLVKDNWTVQFKNWT